MQHCSNPWTKSFKQLQNQKLEEMKDGENEMNEESLKEDSV